MLSHEVDVAKKYHDSMKSKEYKLMEKVAELEHQLNLKINEEMWLQTDMQTMQNDLTYYCKKIE